MVPLSLSNFVKIGIEMKKVSIYHIDPFTSKRIIVMLNPLDTSERYFYKEYKEKTASKYGHAIPNSIEIHICTFWALFPE